MKTDAALNMKNFLSKHIAISVCALFLGGPLLADPTPTPTPGHMKKVVQTKSSQSDQAAANSQPVPPKQVFVLSSGERVILENNVLRIDGHNGSLSPAPAGTYQTRDGRRITVDSQGRASIGR